MYNLRKFKFYAIFLLCVLNGVKSQMLDPFTVAFFESKFEKVLNSIAQLSNDIKEIKETNQKIEAKLNTLQNDINEIKLKQAIETPLSKPKEFVENEPETTVANHVSVVVTSAEQLICDKNLNAVADIFYIDILQNCEQASNGLHPFQPATSQGQIYCAICQENWLIIQRREDGSVNFNRTWEDYKYGFGDIQHEYWIGLERLHQLTSSGTYVLWISLKTFMNEEKHAYYSTLQVGNESENYKLTLNRYSGNAGDSMAYHNEQPFSTFDKDNSGRNCTKYFSGGWWFPYNNTAYCFESHLNGIYNPIRIAEAIEWTTWKGDSFEFVQMAIRPKN